MTATPTATKQAAPAPNGRTLRILVAEDYPVAVTLMQRMLARHGLSADVATDGRQALEALTTRSYDLLLLDLNMPLLSGIEVVRALREQPPNWAAPMIVVISATAFEERPVLNALGITHLIPKPLRAHQLTEVLEQAHAHARNQAAPAPSDR